MLLHLMQHHQWTNLYLYNRISLSRIQCSWAGFISFRRIQYSWARLISLAASKWTYHLYFFNFPIRFNTLLFLKTKSSIFWTLIFPCTAGIRLAGHSSPCHPCLPYLPYLKVIVTVKSSGCLQIGFGPLIIYYICNFWFDPTHSS